VCASVAYDQNGPDADTQRMACENCCYGLKFGGFGPLNDACVCGNPVPGDGAVCAAQNTSQPVCEACCENAGFAEGSSSKTTCYCEGSSTLCASPTGDFNACGICCTEHGYLSYGGLANPPTCICSY
jgi:hypothetical protein